MPRRPRQKQWIEMTPPLERSLLMARIGPKDTKPELAVRRLLHRLGYRYRLHRRDLPGTPDICFPSRRKAIFVHGCFWHRHLNCRRATTPKTRVSFWNEKFEQNVDRDQRKIEALRGLGWHVMVVWECETEKITGLMRRLTDFLSDSRIDVSKTDVAETVRNFRSIGIADTPDA